MTRLARLGGCVGRACEAQPGKTLSGRPSQARRVNLTRTVGNRATAPLIADIGHLSWAEKATAGGRFPPPLFRDADRIRYNGWIDLARRRCQMTSDHGVIQELGTPFTPNRFNPTRSRSRGNNPVLPLCARASIPRGGLTPVAGAAGVSALSKARRGRGAIRLRRVVFLPAFEGLEDVTLLSASIVGTVWRRPGRQRRPGPGRRGGAGRDGLPRPGPRPSDRPVTTVAAHVHRHRAGDRPARRGRRGAGVSTLQVQGLPATHHRT